MGLLGQNPLNEFRPRAIKFSDVYKYGAKRPNLSPTDKKTVFDTLKKAGYSEGQASKIIGQDKVVPIAQIKKIAAALDKSGLKGFELGAQKLVDGYVRKETIRRRNISRVMQERAKEAWEENLGGSKKISPGEEKITRGPKLNF
jgi:hypothetical protein